MAGYVRIGLYPNLGVTWWTAMVVGPDRPVVASVAYDLPVGGGSGLELAARGFEVDAVVEAPLAKLAVRGNVPARVALRAGRGLPGRHWRRRPPWASTSNGRRTARRTTTW